MRADGSKKRRLTSSDESERAPTWSPDGRWIACERGVKGIYLIRPDGTGERRFTPPRTVESHPAWSPDGTRLAFLSDRRSDVDLDLLVATRAGRNARRIVDLAGGVVDIDWGSTGWIAFDHRPQAFENRGLSLVRPSGKHRHRIGQRADIRPVWSPSGKSLLIFREGSSGGMWRMERNGSGRRRIGDGRPLDWIRR